MARDIRQDMIVEWLKEPVTQEVLGRLEQEADDYALGLCNIEISKFHSEVGMIRGIRHAKRVIEELGEEIDEPQD